MTTQDQQPEGIGSTRGGRIVDRDHRLDRDRALGRDNRLVECGGLSRRLREPTHRPRQPNRLPGNRFSLRTSCRSSVCVGTRFRRASSMIPESAFRGPMVSCPMSSTGSRPGSRRRVRGSRSSGLGGEEGSTEDLRIALKRYREFFQRLLAL